MPTDPTPTRPPAALLTALNAVPSVLWSGLALGPLSVFCYQHVARPWLWGLLGVSLLGYAVPRSWFRYWQLSPMRRRYQQLGVPVVARVTQHGTLVNQWLRRRYLHYRRVPHRRAGRALVAESYHMERFHGVLLVFFGLVSFYALAQGHIGWAGLLMLLNVGYNLYPMWLQQYLRVRLSGAGPQ